MTRWQAATIVLGTLSVVALSLLIVALGSIDSIQARLRREHALRVAQDRVLTGEQRHVVNISLQGGVDPAEVARGLRRALDTHPRRFT